VASSRLDPCEISVEIGSDVGEQARDVVVAAGHVRDHLVAEHSSRVAADDLEVAVDPDPSLFQEFASSAFFREFAWLDETAWQEPLTGHGRSLSPLQQQNLVTSFGVHDC
jgi:hypothetical protein